MYIGTEVVVVAIVFFIPIIVLLGTVGYELQINDFSLIVEGTARLIPFPKDFSETYLELRILGAYQFLESGPFSLKFNIGQVSAELVEKAFQLHFVPKIGGTLEFHNLKLSVNYVNKAFVGGIYLRF
ncbi:hypothetical protein [Fervidobacterium sp.]